MLFYVDEFPERLHHTKESQLLFPKLRQRCPDIVPTLDLLDADHARGEAAIRELGHRLLAYEVMGEPRREAFEKACAAYVDNYLRHMALEDSRVLPAARQHPLTGHQASDEYAPLFRRIVDTAPAPIGLGS
jgi:hemerythrin-like domain-containing protein